MKNVIIGCASIFFSSSISAQSTADFKPMPFEESKATPITQGKPGVPGATVIKAEDAKISDAEKRESEDASLKIARLPPLEADVTVNEEKKKQLTKKNN